MIVLDALQLIGIVVGTAALFTTIGAGIGYYNALKEEE